MTRMTGAQASVERKIGRAITKPDGDNDRPYGRCIGQVCGVSYPCTQRMPDEDYQPRVSKSAYQKAKRGENGKKVRCVETGVVYKNMAEAAKAAGISHNALRARLSRSNTTEVNGLTFEAVKE